MMRVLKPAVITEAMVTSSTATAETIPPWDGVTAWAVDAEVYLGERRYRAAVANTNRNPLTDTVFPVAWADIGPTNKMAMFDDVVGTVTVGDSPLAVVMRPGSTEGIGLMELTGRTAVVVMKDAPGGTTVYTRSIDLDGTIIESFYDWFFAEFDPLTDVVLTDLPGQFATCELTVTITATSGNTGIGVCKPGLVIDLGRAQYGATVGIIDYSSKSTDAFGRTSIIERSYSKRGNFSLITEKARFNKIFRTLASLRATLCVYIGTDADGYEPLLMYGLFRDFSIDVAYPQHHLCSIEIEGVI